ncbi:hypothetical protein F4810DRAFT_643546 [Camillea tinctor]|nr:hypothetical protein F4810DRAFT_643546 [Camillea tinctor]
MSFRSLSQRPHLLTRALTTSSLTSPSPFPSPLSHRSPLPSLRHKSTTRGKAVPNRETYFRVNFKRGELPPLSFFEAQLRQPLFDPSFTAESCHAALARYTDLATDPSSPLNWRDKFPATDSEAPSSYPSLATLHTAATALILGPPGPWWRLALHVLHTGVLRGYAPSVLTVVRFAVRARGLGRPEYEVAEAALGELAGGRGEPQGLRADVCTLMGLVSAARGDGAGALVWFRRAVESDAAQQGKSRPDGPPDANDDDDPFRWQWRTSCLVGAAHVRMQRQEPGKAAPLLQYAADTLGNAKACYMLSVALGAEHPRSAFYLERAAVSGLGEACREMARREVQQGREEARGAWERRRALVHADEWLELAKEKELR